MKVSSRGEYGVRAMVALAKHYGQGPMSIASMSKASAVPMPYLEQLIGPLRRAGLVTSTRGARGGYQLSRDPHDVRVGEVYRIMEGPVAPMECVSEDLSEQTCPLIPGCETRPVWLQMRDAIIQTIDSNTLGDLISNAPRQAAAVVASEQKTPTVVS
jgi:Rrf2 family protein